MLSAYSDVLKYQISSLTWHTAVQCRTHTIYSLAVTYNLIMRFNFAPTGLVDEQCSSPAPQLNSTNK